MKSPSIASFLFLGISLLKTASASNYLYGGPDAICWRTEIVNGVSSPKIELDSCPPGMSLVLDSVTGHSAVDPSEGRTIESSNNAETSDVTTLDVLTYQYTVRMTPTVTAPFLSDSEISMKKGK
jgi:hypothetical protein